MAIEQLSHPAPADLRAFGLGRLAEAESADIERHLAECDVCREAVASAPDDSLVARLRRTPGGDTNPGFAHETSHLSILDGEAASESANSQADTAIHPAALHAGEPSRISRPATSADSGSTTLPAGLINHARYRVLEPIGAGGMGAIFKAEHRLMERPVALKMIGRKLTDHPEAVERFQREVKAAARLAHPNIVTAHDAEVVDGAPILVMEFVEGRNLASVVQDRGPLPVAQACDYIRQAALGLQHAFEQGMVHRDIKPHNLVVATTPAGDVVKILDFGLSRFVSEAATASDLTEFGTVMGTADYMAPEQARDAHSADIRADIYSLGCTLYFLLAGRPPFAEGTVAEKVAAHLERFPQPLTALRKDVPPALWGRVRRMLSKHPAARFQTPAEVAQALAPFTQPAKTPRRRWGLIAAAAMLLVALGWGGYVAGPTIYRTITDQGELVVEMDDPEVEELLNQAGLQVTITDVKTGKTVRLDLRKGKGITLKTGDYDIDLASEFREQASDTAAAQIAPNMIGDGASDGQPLPPEPVATTTPPVVSVSPDATMTNNPIKPNSKVVTLPTRVEEPPDGASHSSGSESGVTPNSRSVTTPSVTIWDKFFGAESAQSSGSRLQLSVDRVSLRRGRQEIVKVLRVPAPQATPASTSNSSEPAVSKPSGPVGSPFVILGGQGVPERKFATLQEAVTRASDGDTIEIRGNGPFISSPIDLGKTALTIRAAGGCQPVLRLNSAVPLKNALLLSTQASLVLEGLELDLNLGSRNTSGAGTLIGSDFAPLSLVNCKVTCGTGRGILAGRFGDSDLVIRNCIIEGSTYFQVHWIPSRGNRAVFENNIFTGLGQGALYIHGQHAGWNEPSLQLTRNTLVIAGHSLCLSWETALGSLQPMRVETAGNVFDSESGFFRFGEALGMTQANGGPFPSSEREALLKRLLAWRDQQNLHRDQGQYFAIWRLGTAPGVEKLEPLFKSLADWQRFWDTKASGSVVARAKFQGGNVRGRLANSRETIGPEDFRLLPGSPGYRAGKDGKDLGADIDFVGPGKAYEKWKQTPEYQEWLKETGQLRIAKPASEKGAFAVLTAEGVEVRKFDTLAKAVQDASAGDTIEIRGNGPFVSDPINIQRKALRIRAGEGFRPIINLSPEAAPQMGALLTTNAALVLEGMQFYQAPPDGPPGSSGNTVVRIHGAPLQAANCRFRACIWANGSPVSMFRNCEFLSVQGSFGGPHAPGARVSFDNCVHWAVWSATGSTYHDAAALRDISFQIHRSTFVAPNFFTVLLHGPLPPASQPTQVTIESCVLDCSNALDFGPFPGKEVMLEPAEAEAILLRRLRWQGERNLFASGSTSVRWRPGLQPQPPRGPNSLEEWRQFWGAAEIDSLEGTVRFQGGNLRSRSKNSLDELTAEDFRLRPDSPGYRAGKDGKDLGADVDLVGPGKAYEKWKTTPEYQQWLKDTGQR